MQEIAGWIAPVATTVAAIITAANLGTRPTGWGFVIFTIGSIAWCSVAIATGQSNLLLSNAFLTLVNLVGIWRWLGRQARHDDGSTAAYVRSRTEAVPSLFGVGGIIGAKLTGRDDRVLGTVVDAMMRCKGNDLVYVVVSEGGIAGVGERLHALAPSWLHFSDHGVACELEAPELAALPTLRQGDWPVTLEERELADGQD